MVYLEKLEMYGFKTFGRKTAIEFSPGLTIITGPNGQGKCLVGDMEVLTLRDGWIEIGKLFHSMEGDIRRRGEEEYIIPEKKTKVLSFDRSKVVGSQIRALYRQRISERIFEIHTECGRRLRATGRHRILTNRGWMPIEAIQRGYESLAVYCMEGDSIFLEDISRIRSFWMEGYVYDIHVEETRNYIANGMVVHNSNIIDALRFVLGESSSRTLRAEGGFSELICKNIPAKKGVVKVTINNIDRKIPIDEDRVVISREIRSSGESVYRVNGARCTRNYIRDILSLVGFTPGGYNFVMQGDIQRVILKNPIELRREIEEAIGIAEYDERKRLAEQKLDEADRKLATHVAKLDEKRNYLHRLERQRNSHKRKTILDRELKRIDAIEKSIELIELEKELEERRRKRRELEEKRREIEKNIEEKKGELDKIIDRIERIKNEASSGEYALQKGELVEIETLINSKEEEKERRRKELMIFKEDKKRILDSKKKYRKNLKKIRNYIKYLENILNHLELKIERRRKFYGEVEKKAEEVRGKREEKLREEERLKTILDNNNEKMRTYELQIKNLEDMLENLEENKRRRERRMRTMRKQLRRIEKKLRRLREILKETGEGENTPPLEVESIKRALDELSEAMSMRSQIFLLTTVRDKREVPGIKLREIIEVEEEFQRPVEIMLGEWLDAIIVKDWKEIGRYMKTEGIKLIPINLVTNSKRKIPSYIEKELIPLSSIVKIRREFEREISSLFENMYIAKDWNTALEANRFGVIVGTLRGEVFEPDGKMRVGLSEEGYLRLDEVEKLRKNYLILQKYEERKKERIIEAIKRGLKEAERRRFLDLNDVDRLIGEAERRIREIEEDLEYEEKRRKKDIRKIGEFKSGINKIKQKIEKIEKENIRIIRKIERIRKDIEKYSMRIRRYEKEAEKILKEIEWDNNRKRELEENINRHTDLLRRNMEEYREIRRREREIDSALSESVKRLKTLEMELRALYVRKREKSQSLQKIEASLRGKDNEIRGLEERRKRLKEELEELEEGRRKIEGRIYEVGNELTKLETSYGYKLKELRDLGFSEPIKVGYSENLLRRFREAILRERNMLEFSEGAIGEYREMYREYKMFSERRNKLEEERRSILRMVEEIEERKREKFMEAFERVNRAFGDFFSTITGGYANLELENMEDPFQGGIIMKAAFSGKPMLAVSGLSGGEKSLVAICFIFALQELKPSSIYVMDEADAHLDSKNVERFANFLKERAKRSQIIAVTLKDVVASKADKLYGVVLRNRDKVSVVVEMPKVEAT